MIFGQMLPCCLHRLLIIEGNPQSAFSMFPVMIDSDIFNADALGSQNYGQGRNRSYLVHNIHGKGIFWSDGSLGLIGNRIAVISGCLKKTVQSLIVRLLQIR